MYGMVGRHVRTSQDGEGTVVQWEPYGAQMCDALVALVRGGECWYASHSLKPADDLGPLPDRVDACARRDAEMLTQLRGIKARWDEDRRTVRYCGEMVLDRAISNAISDVKARVDVRQRSRR